MKIPLWSAWRERREWKLNAATSVLANAGVQIQTAAGVSVTETKALAYLPVLACARVLAEDVSTLPLITYERLARGKRRAMNHPLYDLLHTQPNPEMDAVLYRATSQLHLGLWGVSYAEIETADGWPVGLWPLTPWRVTPKRGLGGLYYDVTPPSINDADRAEPVPIPARNMLRIMWLSLNGVQPLSPVGAAREAIGLGMATQEFGSRFFANDARPGFVLQHPGALSDQAYKRIRSTWEQRHQGLTRAHRIAILEEGMQVKEVGLPPEDAQFLETRKFQAEDVARLYRMPQHKIGLLEHATFSNIEHQGIEYVVDTLRPWLVRWEMALLTQLFPPEDRSRYFAEFLVEGLLRGDTVSRYQAYAVGRNWGWLSANDVRERENMNPIDGGDEYLVPLNMIPAGSAPPPAAPPAMRAERRSLAGRRRIAGQYERLFADAAERVVRREKADVLRLADRYLAAGDRAAFQHRLDEFYVEHGPFVRKQMAPVITSYAEAVHGEAAGDIRALPADLEPFVVDYIAAFAARWINSSRSQITALLAEDPLDPIAALADRMTEWVASRPDKTARWETVRAGNAVTQETWRQSGVREKVWVASANACPLCSEMDGQMVSITEFFLNEGDDLSAAGANTLTTEGDVGHPPLHEGCSCSVAPG